eukprot:scaffold114435_cov14-Prasinocladus_malaysianus.AAC.1
MASSHQPAKQQLADLSARRYCRIGSLTLLLLCCPPSSSSSPTGLSSLLSNLLEAVGEKSGPRVSVATTSPAAKQASVSKAVRIDASSA